MKVRETEVSQEHQYKKVEVCNLVEIRPHVLEKSVNPVNLINKTIEGQNIRAWDKKKNTCDVKSRGKITYTIEIGIFDP